MNFVFGTVIIFFNETHGIVFCKLLNIYTTSSPPDLFLLLFSLSSSLFSSLSRSHSLLRPAHQTRQPTQRRHREFRSPSDQDDPKRRLPVPWGCEGSTQNRHQYGYVNAKVIRTLIYSLRIYGHVFYRHVKSSMLTLIKRPDIVLYF